MANSFESLMNSLNSGELGHNHIQIAYRAWIRKREDLPDEIKDALAGEGGIINILFKTMSKVVGTCEIVKRRGNQGGVHDAYLAICEDYPEAAQALLDKYGMDKKGVITL